MNRLHDLHCLPGVWGEFIAFGFLQFHGPHRLKDFESRVRMSEGEMAGMSKRAEVHRIFRAGESRVRVVPRRMSSALAVTEKTSSPTVIQ